MKHLKYIFENKSFQDIDEVEIANTIVKDILTDNSKIELMVAQYVYEEGNIDKLDDAEIAETSEFKNWLQYEIEYKANCSCASISKILECHSASIYHELKRNRLRLPCKAEYFSHTTIPFCKKLLGFPFVCNRCFHFSN